MLERLLEHGRRIGERRAETRRRRIAESLREEAAPGIAIGEERGGILLSGRRLRRRFAIEPRLRWLTAVIR